MPLEEARAIIRDILLHEWDPLGVSQIPEAADEYDSYLPHVHRLIVEGADARKILDYLQAIETKEIGVWGDPKIAERVAARLASL
jgi:hypothetical protein